MNQFRNDFSLLFRVLFCSKRINSYTHIPLVKGWEEIQQPLRSFSIEPWAGDDQFLMNCRSIQLKMLTDLMFIIYAMRTFPYSGWLFSDCISDLLLGPEPFAEHLIQNTHMTVNIVIDHDFCFPCICSMKTSCVLLHVSFPGNWCCQHQRVQTRKVESFADILTDRNQKHTFICRNTLHCRANRVSLFCASATLQKKYMLCTSLEHLLQLGGMFPKPRQQQR